MKFNRRFFSALALGVSLLTLPAAFAHEDHPQSAYAGTGHLMPVTAKTDAAWVAKARADYPLTTCAVSEDKLEGGEMGKPQEFVYMETGKPDLFVRFCCRDCVKDFKKEPVKYLTTIENAAAAKAKTGK